MTSQRVPVESGIWAIVRRALAGAPNHVRRQALVIGVLWLAMLALQIWDSRNAAGVAGVAEFVSAALAASGAAVLGVVSTLQRAVDHTLWHGPDRSASESAGVRGTTDAAARHVLMALTALGFIAGVALGAATMLMLIRWWLGSELPLVVVGSTVNLTLTVIAGREVVRSSRSLLRYAEDSAEIAWRAQADAADARLATLTAQMNPHFLFNALNTIAALTTTSPAAAVRATEHLAGMLRRTLERSASTAGTIADEVDYVRAYLALEQERWGERLRVVWNIGADVGACPLPPLILQPLVENALRHGIGARAEGGEISIDIHRTSGGVALCVRDSGEGFAAGYRERTGLRNLRERLAVCFGAEASLVVHREPGGRVTVAIPIAYAPGARRAATP